MATIKCKMCGGTMEIAENSTVAVCEYCGSQQTIPRLSDERKANLYDRANHFRRGNEFDKAQAIYEQILNEDPNDAESYWSLVLCKYGIEYVEDPATHKMVPTVNRTQFTSVFEDSNYKEAIRLSDDSQRAIYEEEAKAIDDIQKGILEISKNEEPFDVFICYKETDDSGKRTRDSVLGQDLYYELKKAGFKVFFAKITLESKLGTAYEPYIFSALNSSKVMVVIGTKPEYFKAVWVRNEWSRFLDMIKKGEKKTLIPAYRDMDPYDLPEEFSFLQAQDMSKLGFMQDLVAGIKKLIEGPKKTAASADQNKADAQAKKKNPMLARAFLFMEDGEFEKAGEYIDKVLDQEPQNPMAYLASVMTEEGIRKDKEGITVEDLFVIPEDELKKYGNYKKALRFADEEFRREFLERREKYVAEREAEWKRIESEYLSKISEATTFETAKALRNEVSLPEFKKKWASHPDYRELFDKCQDKVSEFLKADYLSKIAEVTTVDAAKNLRTDIKDSGFNEEWSDQTSFWETLDKCEDRIRELENGPTYNEACLCMEKKDFLRAADIFRKLGYFKDSVNKVKECEKLENDRFNQQKYDRATSFIKGHKVDKALKILDGLGDWKDSRELAAQLRKKVKGQKQTFALIILAVIVLALAGYLIYSFVTWKSDETGHWHSIVGSQVGYGEHRYSIPRENLPTCEESGYKGYECDICGHTTVTETIPAIGHNLDDGVIILEPSCAGPGIRIYTCRTCGKKVSEEIPATDHMIDAGKETLPPTCLAEGTKTFTCITCGMVVKTEPIPPTGHVFNERECVKCGEPRYTLGDTGPAGGFIFYDCDADNGTGNKDGLMSSDCGWRYLEAAPADLRIVNGYPSVDDSISEYSSATSEFCFGYYKKSKNGSDLFVNGSTNYYEADCTGISVGTGKTNTQMLVSAMAKTNAYDFVKKTWGWETESTDAYAARLCDVLEYKYNGVAFDDWFLPSKGELELMFNTLYKSRIGNFAILTSYWSSSESRYDASEAWRYSNEASYLTGDYERRYACRIRPIRAF